jgi:pimeloyl-ACP methyl ester carboxylesterase
VLVAQLGTGGESWGPVIDRLAGMATFAYDRPGTGDAPPRPAPNPAIPHSVFAHELGALLEREHLTEPAVIVGHSLGGNIARVYAGLYPERVAGLVLVDPSISQSFIEPGEPPKVDGDGPDATEIDTVRGQVDILTAELPAVPTVVMTRTPGAWDGAYDPPHPAAEDLWLVSQRLLARQAGAPLIVADNTGHQIPRDAPDLVAYVITAVADAVRDGTHVELNIERLTELGGHVDG